MKIIIGESPYEIKGGYKPLTMNINELSSYSTVFGGMDAQEIVVAFIPVYTVLKNPNNLDTFRRVMSILFGKRKAKSQIGEFHGKLKSNDISDYERLSKDLAIMLADKNVVLLNAFNDEKCQQKNELINNCFQYVSEGNGAHQLLLLGSKAIEAWDEWNRNNNDGNRNYTVLSYPHPSRTSGYNKMWNQVDYKKIKTRNYSSLKDIQQFKLN